MTSPVLNRARTRFLDEIRRGKIYQSDGGLPMRRIQNGQDHRVDRPLREAVTAGWAVLDVSTGAIVKYKLTPAGQMALADGILENRMDGAL